MSRFAKFAPFAPIAPIATVGLALGLLLLAAVGCNQSPALDAKTIAVHRTTFTLAEEPDGVQTVADVRSTLLGETADDHEDHDHDGDGIQDHAAADHDKEAHEDNLHQDHDAEDDHDHDAEDHDEDGDDHEGDDHDADGEDREGHDEEHDHEAHAAHDEHDDHEHEHHAHATESMNVVMVGHIGGLANPWAKTVPEFPFAKTQAIFYLADPMAIAENAELAHEHTHAPGEECAFCAAHAEDQADMLAMVQFVDKNGKVLPVDVRQLFEIKEKDMVVVSGKARVTAGGILVIDAEGLYIRN